MKLREVWNKCSNYFTTNKVENGRATARLLLMHLRGYTYSQFICNIEQELDPNICLQLKQLQEQIVSGRPLQYILGSQEFMGLKFYVNENVLIPRPETELLVNAVLAKAKCNTHIRIADIGTGSGAIVISLATRVKKAIFTAIDISEEALAVAKINACKHQVHEKITFLQGDLLNPLLETSLKYQIIVSNPPYITAEEMKILPLNVKQEPSLALSGGADGLNYYSRLTEGAPKLLSDGGYLLVEIGSKQGEAVKKMFELNSFCDIDIISDYANLDRIVVGKYNKKRL